VGEWLTFAQAQRLSQCRCGRLTLDQQHLVEDRMALAGHGFGQALQAAEFLVGLGRRHKGALARHFEDQPLMFQRLQRLAHGDARDTVVLHQLGLRGHAPMRRPGAADDALAQILADARVQGHRVVAPQGSRRSGRRSGKRRIQLRHGQQESTSYDRCCTASPGPALRQIKKPGESRACAGRWSPVLLRDQQRATFVC
jgi:hypothetical protein